MIDQGASRPFLGPANLLQHPLALWPSGHVIVKPEHLRPAVAGMPAVLGARELLRSTGLYAAVAILRIPYQLPGRLAPLFCEVSEGRDYVGQGRIFGYCGIGPGLRGGLINVFPGAQDSHGYLRATLPELGDQFGSFSIREGQVEHRHVERLAASDQSSPFLQRAGQGNLRALHLPENELEGLREGRVVFYYHHPLRRYTSCPTNRPSTTLTEKGQNVHSTKELDLKRVSPSILSLENTYDTGIVLLAEPERGSHFI